MGMEAAMEELQGWKMAILIDNGFEHAEMTEPREALEEALQPSTARY
jgi:hypothetical protein